MNASIGRERELREWRQRARLWRTLFVIAMTAFLWLVWPAGNAPMGEREGEGFNRSADRVMETEGK